MELLGLISEILYVIAFLEARTVGDSRQGLFLLYDCLNPTDLYLVVAHPIKFSDGLYNRYAIGIYTK